MLFSFTSLSLYHHLSATFFSFFSSFFSNLDNNDGARVNHAVTLHVDVALSSLAIYQSFYILDVMSPRLLLLSYGWREDVMTHIHVTTNTIISFTVGKHISLEEEKKMMLQN